LANKGCGIKFCNSIPLHSHYVTLVPILLFSHYLSKPPPTSKDGNGAVSGRISAGFGSSGFGFGLDFLPTVFGFGAPKLIGFGFGFGFSPVDIQWITEISHYELKFMFYYILIIIFTYILF
jgi:hypothetical protein